MKKIIMIAAVLVLFTACSKEESFSPVKSGTKLIATAGAGTKTTLNGLKVNWTAGDQMVIYDGSAHTFTADASGARVPISSDDELSRTGTYYGLYPAEAFEGISGSTISSTIQVNQFVATGQNWDPTATVLAGTCDATAEAIPFVNAHALVQVTLPAPANSITINTGAAVSGDFSFNVATSTLTPSANTSQMVALTTSGTDFASDTPYYVATLPKTSAVDTRILVRYTGTTPSTSPGTGTRINQTGVYFYNFIGNRVSIGFPFNKISQIDLRNATGLRLNGPLNDFKAKGSYLFVGPDGSCIFTKDKNGNDFKFQDLHAEVYWTDTGDDDYTIDDSAGTHTMGFDLQDGLESIYIYIENPKDSGGTTHTGRYYLAYCHHHNGAFYCVASRAEATPFAGYKFD